jgi:hypothetical protein
MVESNLDIDFRLSSLRNLEAARSTSQWFSVGPLALWSATSFDNRIFRRLKTCRQINVLKTMSWRVLTIPRRVPVAVPRRPTLGEILQTQTTLRCPPPLSPTCRPQEPTMSPMVVPTVAIRRLRGKPSATSRVMPRRLSTLATMARMAAFPVAGPSLGLVSHSLSIVYHVFLQN